MRISDWSSDVCSSDLSCPSFNELARDGQDAERHNRFHPEAKTPRKPYITEQLEGRQGTAIVATDYIRAYPEQVRAYVPMHYTVLGTDGYGRTDTRAHLRPPERKSGASGQRGSVRVDSGGRRILDTQQNKT